MHIILMFKYEKQFKFRKVIPAWRVVYRLVRIKYQKKNNRAEHTINLLNLEVNKKKKNAIKTMIRLVSIIL